MRRPHDTYRDVCLVCREPMIGLPRLVCSQEACNAAYRLDKNAVWVAFAEWGEEDAPEEQEQ